MISHTNIIANVGQKKMLAVREYLFRIIVCNISFKSYTKKGRLLTNNISNIPMTDEKKCPKCDHEHSKEDGTCTCGCEEGKK